MTRAELIAEGDRLYADVGHGEWRGTEYLDGLSVNHGSNPVSPTEFMTDVVQEHIVWLHNNWPEISAALKQANEVIANDTPCLRETDDLPPVHQPPIDRTIQMQFVDAGEHKPWPFPEEPDDVAELVRRVRKYVDVDTVKQLADACERLAKEKVQLRLALKLLQGMLRVMPLDDGRLYFDDDFDAMNFIENILKEQS